MNETYSEALNVHRAFNISLVVGGSVFLAAVLFVTGYLLVEEIKYRRRREGKHTTTQDNLPIVELEEDSPQSKFGPGHVSKTTKVVVKHRLRAPEVPDYMEPFDPAVTTPDLARIVQSMAVNGKHHAQNDELVYSVADTVVDMGIPREVFDHDRPMTRLDFLKATDTNTDYFEKIKDMVDGIQ